MIIMGHGHIFDMTNFNGDIANWDVSIVTDMNCEPDVHGCDIIR